MDVKELNKILKKSKDPKLRKRLEEKIKIIEDKKTVLK